MPGPGSYRSPSDFGQYDGDVYNLNLGMYKTGFSQNNSKSRLNDTLRSNSKGKKWNYDNNRLNFKIH